MPESFKSRSFRWGFNFFPAFRGTGGRISYISDDWHEVSLKVPLSWRTRNYVGTIYGGSIYGAVDPIYMLMLMRILGPDYIVWDKAAKIRFKKPGKGTLYAEFKLLAEEIDEIERALAISYDMFTMTMKAVRPGLLESEAAGIVEGIALKNG